jgi:hypothetical protein
MLLFAKEEDILRAKLAFEAKTGIDGALTLFDLYNLLRLDMLFDFKLALEFKFLLDFHLVFNLDFDLEITIPPIMFPKARYGFAIYGTDVYDPEIPPPRYEPVRIEVFKGPDAWKEKAVWNLTYKYTMHDRYFYNQSLPEAEKRARAYSEYFTRSPEYEVPGEALHFVSRATEFIYTAACWYDFNSFDIGRFWPGKVPMRVPRDGLATDEPYHDLDMFDSVRFDEMLRPDAVIWVTDPYMTAMRFDLAEYDYAKFDLIEIGPEQGLTHLTNYLQTANIGEKMQTEMEDYAVRSDPLVAGMIWTVTSDRFGPNWVQHGVRMHRNAIRIASVLDQYSLLERLGYQGFARELRTRDTTLGRASAEKVIAKYAKMGLDEAVLRRIAAMVEKL